MCKLKEGKFDDAMWDCKEALRIDPGNEKGHFRRSMVQMERVKRELKEQKQRLQQMVRKLQLKEIKKIVMKKNLLTKSLLKKKNNQIKLNTNTY